MQKFKPERVALYSLAGLLAGLVLIGALLLWFDESLKTGQPREIPPAHSPLHEAEFESGTMRKTIVGPQKERLESYGWISKEKGIARIPVSRAIQILEEKR